MADHVQPAFNVGLALSHRRRVLQRPIIGLDRAEAAVERYLQAVGEGSDDIPAARANAARSYNVAKAVLDGRLMAAHVAENSTADDATVDSDPATEAQ